MTPPHESELEGLFQSELQSVNADVRRKAALSAFAKLRPSNRITVEQFLDGLQRHPEMWAAVSTLGIVDFATALSNSKEAAAAPAARRRRSGFSDEQKNNLKNAILIVLKGQTRGMNRSEITSAIAEAGLTPLAIAPQELSNKLRQPLQELVVENMLHTIGERRLMKYFPGGRKNK